MDIAPRRAVAPALTAVRSRPSRWCAFFLAAAALLALTGCSVFWISAYDKDAADRTTEISKQVIKFYQEVLAVEQGKRKTAVGTTLAGREGDVESLMRLHLLKEQARQKNAQSITVAENMLESWRQFSLSHRTGDGTALGDAALEIERGIMERHFRAAFVAEEAKKLGSSN